jgi:hypothetical protein
MLLYYDEPASEEALAVARAELGAERFQASPSRRQVRLNSPRRHCRPEIIDALGVFGADFPIQTE